MRRPPLVPPVGAVGCGATVEGNNFQWKLAKVFFFSKSIFIRSSADNVKGNFANIFVNTKIQRIFLQIVSSIGNQLTVVFFQLGLRISVSVR